MINADLFSGSTSVDRHEEALARASDIHRGVVINSDVLDIRADPLRRTKLAQENILFRIIATGSDLISIEVHTTHSLVPLGVTHAVH